MLLLARTDTTHTMGIGAVVINEQRQVLAVQEATGPASKLGGANDFWKYPTGCVCLPLYCRWLRRRADDGMGEQDGGSG